MAVIPDLSVVPVPHALAVMGLGLLLTLLYLVAKIVYNVFFHPLSKYPGPKRMSATRIPYLRLIMGGRYAQKIKALHEQYGHIVRIAPDELSITHGDAWKVIYGTRPGHGQKEKDARFYPPTVGNAPSIISSDHADHSRFRRLLSYGFSDSSLRAQEPIIQSYVNLFIQRLREKIDNGTPVVDLVSWYNFLTFDVIGDLAFGEPFDCLKNSEYHDWITILFSHLRLGAYSNVCRRFPGSKWLLPLVTPKRLMAQRNWHAEMTKEKVMARTTAPKKGFSIPEMITNGSTLIIAGSETTATLLSGVTYLLLRNPRVLAKLQHEIRSTFKSDDEINLDSCNKLEYCLATLTEALRMYPPVSVGLPRIMDAQGDTIAGNYIPGGTVVSVPQLAANHSPMNFVDADQFLPERHLEDLDPKFANDCRQVMQPFSVGPRNCIGRNLAYVELRIILSRMIFNFDMELAEPEKDWLDQDCFTLWDKPALNIKLSLRDKQQ
ncbi:hypothetical protein N7540_011789 [Penicillium herquei]|nr:hypothetical protein N7540_011789 [Penicillium herquei]